MDRIFNFPFQLWQTENMFMHYAGIGVGHSFSVNVEDENAESDDYTDDTDGEYATHWHGYSNEDTTGGAEYSLEDGVTDVDDVNGVVDADELW